MIFKMLDLAGPLGRPDAAAVDQMTAALVSAAPWHNSQEQPVEADRRGGLAPIASPRPATEPAHNVQPVRHDDPAPGICQRGTAPYTVRLPTSRLPMRSASPGLPVEADTAPLGPLGPPAAATVMHIDSDEPMSGSPAELPASGAVPSSLPSTSFRRRHRTPSQRVRQ